MATRTVSDALPTSHDNLVALGTPNCSHASVGGTQRRRG